MRRLLLGLALALCSAVFSWAGTPYPVTPKAGAWMICVTSYTGEGSEDLANKLAASLRTDYRVAAYVYNRGEEERRKEQARVDEAKRRQLEYLKAHGASGEVRIRGPKTMRIEDSFAVLVGGWPDMDTARKALDEVRRLKPPDEKLQHRTVDVTPGRNGKPDIKTIPVNPFTTAFVVHNPVVPVERSNDPAKLENLKELNSGESFSLLKCGKPWTLVVKQYQGGVVLQQVNGQSVFGGVIGSKQNDQISASGKQAHSTAELLRMLKFEAYVLHTEGASYVTIGAYDRPDDPKLLQDQKTLSKLELRGSTEKLMPPLPMAVPKP